MPTPPDPDIASGVPGATVMIIDFGSQYTRLVARRVREIGVFSVVIPASGGISALRRHRPGAVILSGGPGSVANSAANIDSNDALMKVLIAEGIPILGICFGMQLLCRHLGGSVETAKSGEYGSADLRVDASCGLYEGLWTAGSCRSIWASHGDRVMRVPSGFRIVASSDNTPCAIMADEGRDLYGVQFHPEVSHTDDGTALLRRFVVDISGLRCDWRMDAFCERSIMGLREQIGDGKVICGLSGGVDSTVTAMLLHRAIGDRLHCVLIDTGLLREFEAERVRERFAEDLGIPLTVDDAGGAFFAALKGLVDPERKRKAIGGCFIDRFRSFAMGRGKIDFLAQGTLYPDVIESSSPSGAPSSTIKSHHNVGGLPSDLDLRLVEPLRDLFKDEVRELGRELGLSDRLVMRHPFPGPGLAIRIPGVVTRRKVSLLRRIDSIYLAGLRESGLYERIWQAFAVLLPVRAVGVMGDSRTHGYACVLRAVTTRDAMTASIYPFEMEFLSQMATRLMNEVSGIGRVLYDITSKPPGTIEWE